MSPDALLLPSPLLPTSPYRDLLTALRERGCTCELADASSPRSGEELIARWSAVASPDMTLIAHSNAGYLAPSVRSAVGSDQLVLFMDAAVPAAEGATYLAPGWFRSDLTLKADGGSGLLPPWTRWWHRDVMGDVIPADVFDRVDAECPRLPLSYFETSVRVPSGWTDAANAYLAFGDTYAEELALARGMHWPMKEIPGGHLEFMWDPSGVAGHIVDLLATAGRERLARH